MEELAPRRKKQQVDNDRRGRKASMNVFRLSSAPVRLHQDVCIRTLARDSIANVTRLHGYATIHELLMSHSVRLDRPARGRVLLMWRMNILGVYPCSSLAIFSIEIPLERWNRNRSSWTSYECLLAFGI